MHSTLDLGGDEGSPRQPASSGMERVSSLTTFMNSGGQAKVPPRVAEKDRVRQAAAGLSNKSPRPGGRGRFQRRRLYSSLVRLLGLVAAALLVLYTLRNLAISISSRSKLASADAGDEEGPAWLSKLPGQKLLFDSLETVPMPVRTHPRTPRRGEQYKLSLADYLKTRLGSHFAFPSANTPSRSTRGSQLWLTSATGESIGVSTPHLVTFFRRLQSASAGPPSSQDDLLSPFFSSSRPTNASLPFENSNQRHADRALVVLCRDDGCMDYCRGDKELYCFGGFASRRNTRDPLAKAGLNAANADEIAKIRGMLETLETGRRVFWIDDGTYLRQDPVPWMSDLSEYDMQIPDNWATGKLNSGISFFNPTQRTISLFQKLLNIAELPLERDRLTWASTNLLIDPRGEQRDFQHTHAQPKRPSVLDDDIFDNAPSFAAKAGYGQVEFESPWEGGLDVRILDVKKFRTSSGRLGRKQFDFEKKRREEALYFHCLCCGDVYTNDLIAGALGFHQPSVTYDLATPTSVPKLPLVLKLVSLSGTAAEMQHAMSFLLQIAHDSGRTVVPPLTGTLLDKDDQGNSRKTEKYVWRLFPVSIWAHPSSVHASTLPQSVHLPPPSVKVREPSYVQHAADHLRSTFPDQRESTRLVAELTETLVLDVSDPEIKDLKDLVQRLTRPFWSTERIVALEGIERVAGKKGWKLESEFERVSMCKVGLESREKESCDQLCPL
ncbi:hypothetical protein Rt10032_c06g2984 [Rhodotorula toruloides]|uniref:Uncharacterized protein n=1 Tax=Rhodotorula toruloides TaxID=5286 RepID=A0A511KF14_RHOTO|nr:hypothetical protein Rt10032_c06g2984 [Rhodotorula toruloides]